MSPTNSRMEELEQRFSQLEPQLDDSPEKEALSILHAMIQESRRSGTGRGEGGGSQGRSLDEVAKLYKTAPSMEGKATNEGLPVGGPAPNFVLKNGQGEMVSLSDFRGRNVVLVFYPLDWSPGCSDQLSLYQSELTEFEKYDAQVLGISVDSIYSHGAWAAVRGIEFPLLSDFHIQGRVARQYNVMRDVDGFSERALFIIDREGIIRYKTVSPQIDHIPDIYELFDQLKGLAANEGGGEGTPR